MRKLRLWLRRLYEDDADWARGARDALLAFDMSILIFVVGTSFLPAETWVEWTDALLGLVLLIEFLGRLFASREPRRKLFDIWNLVDAVSIFSFLVPVSGEAFGFLRALRVLRVLRLYRVLDRLRIYSDTFRRNEDTTIAAANLVVFIFIMTGIIYATQHKSNPLIANYVDALYFTITCLTTTGFGDITLRGTSGRLLSVIIMLAGVTLFLRLAQVMLRPPKVRFECPNCGLLRHELDAVHCKACGVVLHIPDEGAG
jgi:voltage-gated potassium channel